MRRTHSSGFTLIELLVVIAIIAMLAAILFPVYSSAREKARQTVCLSNQRQIAMSIEIYIQNNSEMLPRADTVWSAVGGDMKKVLICPTQGTDVPIGYLYNNALDGQPLGRITMPLSTLMTIDGQHPATNTPLTYANVLYTAQDVLRCHNGRAICAFVDGHCGTDNDLTGFAYKLDFAQSVGGEWSSALKDATPAGARPFLGQFNNQTVSLTLDALPKHHQVTLACDLYLLRNWAGNTGPHTWTVRVAGGSTLLTTTFSNTAGAEQSFPDAYPGGHHPPFTGALEYGTLGYSASSATVLDSVYHLNYTFDHSARQLRLDFSAGNLPPVGSASWGLANVNVTRE